MSKEPPRYWLDLVCHDCKVKVGKLHLPGCDMEFCPICGGQLISCGHYEEIFIKKMDRIPYIQPLVNCGVCGIVRPDFFKVPDDEWDKYVIPPLQEKVLCMDCYQTMRRLFPNGWRNIN